MVVYRIVTVPVVWLIVIIFTNYLSPSRDDNLSLSLSLFLSLSLSLSLSLLHTTFYILVVANELPTGRGHREWTLRVLPTRDTRFRFLSIGHTSDSYWVRKRPDGQFHFSHRFFAHYLILVRPVDKLLPRVTGIFMPDKNTVNIIDQKKTRLKSVYYFIFVMVTCQLAGKKNQCNFF